MYSVHAQALHELEVQTVYYRTVSERSGARTQKEKEIRMPKKEILDKLSIYIPQRKMAEKPVERLIKLGDKLDRSINYLVVEAIIQFLDREEKKN